MEPSGETLVAYAAKEGTVASDGAGRNSPYSEALLGHLEEPGLEVGLMFRQVRDAVVGMTGGRQEPFVYGSLSSRGVYLAAEPAPPAAAAVSSTQPSGAEESGALRVAAESELLFWKSVKDSEDPADIQAYLDRYPNSAYEVLGRNRLKRLDATAKDTAAPAPGPPPSSLSARMEEAQLAAEREFWVLVKESEVPSDLEAYLEHYPDGVYAPLARIRLAQLRRERPAQQAGASPIDAATPEGTPVASASPSATAPAAAPAVPSPEDVESSLGLGRGARRMVQAGLSSLGYEPGPADGLFGARTRDAIRRYQGEKGFEATGYLRGEETEALVALGEEAALAQAKAKAERREVQRRADEAHRADDEAFASAKSSGTVEAYGTYLDTYPSGQHVAQARRLRSEAETRERERREQTPGRRFRDCAECPELVVVPAGSFMMGSPSSDSKGYSDERPVHRVTIGEPIAVGVYEVTFGEWDACRRGGGCSHNPGDRGWGRGTRPVIEVSWEDAQEYVRWLSRETGKRYRLMSESEWEYVARSGTETRYHWGDAAGRNRANCNGCGSRWDNRQTSPGSSSSFLGGGYVRGSRWDNRQTSPVGSFSANAFGLHDVHGNVWEWVEDCWHGDYAGAPPDGSAWTSGGDCSRRVLRGGSWGLNPRGVRSAYRVRFATGYRSGDLGFRVARTLD